MIKTESGYVSGFNTRDNAVSIFKGIPYASSTKGKLRWKAPEKFPSWEGVRECKNFSASAIQPPQASFMMWTEEFIIDTSAGYSEDSLTLNIFCPYDVNVKDKPVIVYFHGGSFVSGGSSCEIYNGEQLAKRGVIFITVNFRVGILGLLASSELSKENPDHISGNYQILDQIAALKWVRNNIHEFGGNPENITIMGQSSGAASVCTLAVSPLAKNLFKRVFALSHETLNMPVSAAADENGNFVYRNIYEPLKECESEGDRIITSSLEDMRSKTPDELLKFPVFYPYCIDGHVLTSTFNEGVRAGLTDDYDFMVTYTASDPYLFMIIRDMTGENDYESVMRGYFGEHAERAMKLYPFEGTAQEFGFRISKERYTASVMMLASLRKNSNTWVAEFDHVMPGPESKTWGAFHTSDVPYWLDYFSDKRKEFWSKEDYMLGEELVARLAAFARTGKPECENLTEWKPSDGSSIYKIEAGSIQEVHPLSQEKYQLWRDLYCVN